MAKEFSPTHKWKQYPGIEFEINMDTNKVRAKGKNDCNASKWSTIRSDINGIYYFTVCGERIYWFDIEKIA